MELKFGAQFLTACMQKCVYNFNHFSRGLKFRGLSFRSIINAGLLRDLTLGLVTIIIIKRIILV